MAEETGLGSSLPQKGLPYSLQREVRVTEEATPGPDYSISMHRCSKWKAPFSDASPPSLPVILPPHHHQSFPLVQKVPSLTHPSSFVPSPKPLEAQGAGEDVGESPGRRTAGDPCQVCGRKESIYPSPCQLLEHLHPCETPPLS